MCCSGRVASNEPTQCFQQPFAQEDKAGSRADQQTQERCQPGRRSVAAVRFGRNLEGSILEGVLS